MDIARIDLGGDVREFPFGISLLLYGSVGSGKTTFCLNLVKEFLSNSKPVVWFCLDTSPQRIREQLEYFEVDYAKYEQENLLVYIDAYSSQVSMDSLKEPSIIPVSSAANLNELNMALKKAFAKINDPGIVIFDSVSNLLLYTNQSLCEEFIKVNMNRVSVTGWTGFYIMQKDLHDKRTEETLKMIADGVLDFDVEDNNRVVRVMKLPYGATGDWIASNLFVDMTGSKKKVSREVVEPTKYLDAGGYIEGPSSGERRQPQKQQGPRHEGPDQKQPQSGQRPPQSGGGQQAGGEQGGGEQAGQQGAEQGQQPQQQQPRPPQQGQMPGDQGAGGEGEGKGDEGKGAGEGEDGGGEGQQPQPPQPPQPQQQQPQPQPARMPQNDGSGAGEGEGEGQGDDGKGEGEGEGDGGGGEDEQLQPQPSQPQQPQPQQPQDQQPQPAPSPPQAGAAGGDEDESPIKDKSDESGAGEGDTGQDEQGEQPPQPSGAKPASGGGGSALPSDMEKELQEIKATITSMAGNMTQDVDKQIIVTGGFNVPDDIKDALGGLGNTQKQVEKALESTSEAEEDSRRELDHLGRRKDSADRELRELEARLRALEKTLDDKHKRLLNLQEQKRKSMTDYEKSMEDLKTLKSRINSLEERKKHIDDTVKEITNIDQASLDISPYLKQLIRKKEQDVTELKEKAEAIESLESDMVKSVKKLEDEYNSVREGVEDKRYDLDYISQKHTNISSRLETIVSQRKETQEKLATIVERRKALMEKLKQLDNKSNENDKQ